MLEQPAAPSMLGDPPKLEERSKRPSGEALAAALASAGKPSNGRAKRARVELASCEFRVDGGGRAQARRVAGLGGGRSADVAAGRSADRSVDAAPATAPLAPLPPVLPSGSTPIRNDKSTISVSVPPQVKVATVEAKHVEAKQPAHIVEDKPKAEIVDDGKATLVDSKPPEIIVPKLVDGKLPSLVADAKPTEAKPEPEHRRDGPSRTGEAGGEAAGKQADKAVETCEVAIGVEAPAVAVRRGADEARQREVVAASGVRGIARTGPTRIERCARGLGLGHRQARSARAR